MLVAWLGTQLAWDYVGSSSEENGNTFRFARPQGDEIKVRLVENGEGAPLGKIILANDDTTVSICREVGKTHLALSLQAPNHEVNQMTPADPDDRVELVAEQLSRGGKNSLFRKVWPLFFRMLDMEPPVGCKEAAS
jgi:hypothetical protein